MVTVGDAVLSAIDTNWSGAGGAKPTIISEEDETHSRFKTVDWILARTFSRGEDIAELNDTYVKRDIMLTLRVNAYDATNKEARLEEIVTEIERIMNNDGVTGFHSVKVRRIDYGPTDKRVKNVCRADLTVSLKIRVQDGATAPGSTIVVSDWTVTGDLTVDGATNLKDGLTVRIDGVSDYLYFMNSGLGLGYPTIKLTNPLMSLASEDANYVGLIMGESGTDYVYLQWDKTNNRAELTTTGELRLQVSGDLDDYFKFETVAHQPKLSAVGADLMLDDNVIVTGTLALTGNLLTTSFIMRETTGSGLHLCSTNNTADGIRLKLNDAAAGLQIYYDNVEIASINSAGDLQIDGTFAGMTEAQLADLLMYGSANAAWVPMAYIGVNVHDRVTVAAGQFRNTGAGAMALSFTLTLPCTKGTLKLYIKSLKIGVQDADDGDYINTSYIYGYNELAQTQIDIDATDHKTAGDKTFAGAVIPASAVDVSGYQSVVVHLVCVNADASDLDITNVRMECYYA